MFLRMGKKYIQNSLKTGIFQFSKNDQTRLSYSLMTIMKYRDSSTTSLCKLEAKELVSVRALQSLLIIIFPIRTAWFSGVVLDIKVLSWINELIKSDSLADGLESCFRIWLSMILCFIFF